MWIICSAEDSHEILTDFLWKKFKKKEMLSAAVVTVCLFKDI